MVKAINIFYHEEHEAHEGLPALGGVKTINH
jgi:hypothetical protein